MFSRTRCLSVVWSLMIWQVLQDWSMLKVTICGPYTLSLCPGTRLPCLCLCLKWHVFTCLSNTCRCTLFLAFGIKRIAIGWGVERSSSSPFRKTLYKVDLTIPLPNLTLNNTHVYYILIVLFYLAQQLTLVCTSPHWCVDLSTEK